MSGDDPSPDTAGRGRPGCSWERPWKAPHEAPVSPGRASTALGLALHTRQHGSERNRRPPRVRKPRTWGARGPLAACGVRGPGPWPRSAGRGPHSRRSSRSHRGRTHVGVAVHTEDLLQQRGETGKDADAAPEAHGQDHVGLVPGELRGAPVSPGAAAGCPRPPSAWPSPPCPGPTKPTSFSPSRNATEVEWAAPAEGGVGGTLSQRHMLASRQARPAGMT